MFGRAGAAELRGDLERATGLDLPPTLAFDYPTSAEMATMLAARMSAVASASADEAQTPDDSSRPMQPAPALPDTEVQTGMLALTGVHPRTSPAIFNEIGTTSFCPPCSRQRSNLVGWTLYHRLSLASIHADVRLPAARARSAYCNPRAPTLTRPGYFTRPSLKRLQRMRSRQLQARSLALPAKVCHMQGLCVCMGAAWQFPAWSGRCCRLPPVRISEHLVRLSCSRLWRALWWREGRRRNGLRFDNLCAVLCFGEAGIRGALLWSVAGRWRRSLYQTNGRAGPGVDHNVWHTRGCTNMQGEQAVERFVVGERGIGEVALIGPADSCMHRTFC